MHARLSVVLSPILKALLRKEIPKNNEALRLNVSCMGYEEPNLVLQNYDCGAPLRYLRIEEHFDKRRAHLRRLSPSLHTLNAAQITVAIRKKLTSNAPRVAYAI